MLTKLGALVTRVSLETFIRKGKITEGTNLESQHLVPASLQFLPRSQDPSFRWSACVAAHSGGPELHLGSAGLQTAKPWVLQCYWKQNTLSFPQPLHQAGPIQGDQSPLSPREQGVFICFVHHHRPSPQKSGWHIIGSLQIFIWWMNEWLNFPGSLHPSLLHSGWASWSLPLL